MSTTKKDNKQTVSKKSISKTSDNQYSFVSRFGIIADSGTTTIPRLITNHYAELGIKPQVAMLIVHIYDFKWTSEDPFPSLEKVAKLMGLTRRAINKYLEELKSKKLLDVYPRFDPKLGQQSNVYDFTRLVDKVVKLEEIKLKKEADKAKNTPPLNKRSSPPLNKRSNEKEEVKKEEDINSNRKISNIEKSERGGGIKKLSDLLPTISKHTEFEVLSGQNEAIPPGGMGKPRSKNSPYKKPLQPLREPTRIDVVMEKVSQDIRDAEHQWHNRKQAKNIFATLESRGVSESQFIDTLMNVRGLTLEVIDALDNPGAYFFKVLRDKWNINPNS